MTIPVEDVLAAWPPSHRAGRLVLKPLTVGGALALTALGVDFARRTIPDCKLPLAAAVLSGLMTAEEAVGTPATKGEGSRCKAIRLAIAMGGDVTALQNAVERVLNDAFATRVKAAPPEKVSLTPHGMGWPLEIAEFLCAEYGWSFEAALTTPLARAWALAATCRQRCGGKHGDFDYVERVESERIRRGNG